MTRSLLRLASLPALVLLAGCATLMHGTSQDVGLASNPTAARVSVDGKALGETPTVAKLPRKDHHVVKFELEGYAPTELTLTRGVSGWVVGNIIFGGLIGLAVDAISGGLYKLTPAQLEATLAQPQVVVPPGDGLYVTVVLRPDPSWEKVGQLQRE